MSRIEKSHHLPILIWDGDCDFCKRCLQIWQRWTGGKVNSCPYQQFEGERLGISDRYFSKRVYFLDTDHSIAGGAEAIFKSLRVTKAKRLFAWYHRNRAFAKCSEAAYSFVANHREAFSKLLFFFNSQRRKNARREDKNDLR